MMFRTNYRAWLIPYLEGSLDAKRTARLEERLRIDPALAEEAAGLRAVIGAVRSAAIADPVPTSTWSVWPRVELAIRRNPILRRVLAPAPAATAAGLVAVCALLAVSASQHKPPIQSPAVSSVARNSPVLAPMAGLTQPPLPALAAPYRVAQDLRSGPPHAVSAVAVNPTARRISRRAVATAPVASGWRLMAAQQRPVKPVRGPVTVMTASGTTPRPLVAPPPPPSAMMASAGMTDLAEDIAGRRPLPTPMTATSGLGLTDIAPAGKLSAHGTPGGKDQNRDDIGVIAQQARTFWQNGTDREQMDDALLTWQGALIRVERDADSGSVSADQAVDQERSILAVTREAGALPPLQALLERQRTLARSDEQPWYWRVLAVLYEMKGQTERATDAWAHLTLNAAGRRPEDWYQLGRLRAGAADTLGAAAAYNHAAADLPADSEHQKLATAWLAQHGAASGTNVNAEGNRTP